MTWFRVFRVFRGESEWRRLEWPRLRFALLVVVLGFLRFPGFEDEEEDEDESRLRFRRDGGYNPIETD